MCVRTYNAKELSEESTKDSYNTKGIEHQARCTNTP